MTIQNHTDTNERDTSPTTNDIEQARAWLTANVKLDGPCATLYENSKPVILAEYAAHVTAELKTEIKDLYDVLEDKQRLVREIDVIINGEGAALRPSLCDVVSCIKKLRAENERLRHILTFDPDIPGVEEAAIYWSCKIAGKKNEPPDIPDPVCLLEICEDIAKKALGGGEP